MPINKIINDATLHATLRNSIGEEGITVGIAKSLLTADDCLDNEVVAILKLDSFFAYNSRETPNPPKAIDYLVVVRCCDRSIRLYLIELRKSEGRNRTDRISPQEIVGKFQTVANDFFPRFPEIFNRENVSKVTAHLVTDPWKLRDKPDADNKFSQKIKLSALDRYGSQKPLSILGRAVIINPILPPNPIIEPC